MHARKTHLLSAALFSGSAIAASCREVTFQVKGSTTANRDLSSVNLSNVAEVLSLVEDLNLPQQVAQGEETLVGTYCEPDIQNSNSDKIQLLFHSILATRNQWSSLDGCISDLYSWVKSMTGEGYPTIAFDRIGNGKSSRPEPLKTQIPYEIQLYHDLISQVRSGETGQLPQAFPNIVWVGNSYGSALGAALAREYPEDVDSYILTGFSKDAYKSLLGTSAILGAAPAQVADSRFASLPVGYLTATQESGMTKAFFGSPSEVEFDPNVAHQFFEKRDTVTIGQFVWAYIPPQTASKYKGRVLLLNGEQDQAFCGLGDPALGKADCGEVLRDTGSLFPAAEFNYQAIDKCGHALHLHTNGPKASDITKRFLDGEKFENKSLL